MRTTPRTPPRAPTPPARDRGQPSQPRLLTQAFGSAEGGLIFRGGIEAIEEARREIVVLREDLSNIESA